MGGDKMKRKKMVAFWRQKQYVIAGTLVLIGAIGMTWLYTSEQTKVRKEKERQLAQQVAEAREEELAQKKKQEAEEPKENLSEASSIVPPQSQPQPQIEEAEGTVEEAQVVAEESKEPKEPETVETNATKQALHFSEAEGLVWPLQGEVIMDFHMDQTVYFATLDQYKYNPAILIAGDVNSKVCAAARGVITDISMDEVTGSTVTMDLGDGYTAIYGQLKELNFKVGDTVEEGQVLGYVSEPTKYFSVEGSNLYFELQKDGIPQDPVAMMNS